MYFEKIFEEGSLRDGFERVRRNHGCAGVDGVSISDFARDLEIEIHRLHDELRRRSYLRLPLLRIAVQRPDGETRQLAVPAVRDRAAQAAALLVLDPLFEAAFENCSFGYRKGRSVRDAVAAVSRAYAEGFRWVLDADIDAFFDRVDHSLLLERTRRLIPDADVLGLIEAWISPWIWDGSCIYRLDIGLPQGNVISPALANLFLDDFDEALCGADLRLVRYADDFVVLCRSEERARQAARLTDEVLESLHLELDESDIASFDQGFSFLGATFMRSLVVRPWAAETKARRPAFVPPPMNPDALRDWRDLAARRRQ